MSGKMDWTRAFSAQPSAVVYRAELLALNPTPLNAAEVRVFSAMNEACMHLDALENTGNDREEARAPCDLPYMPPGLAHLGRVNLANGTLIEPTRVVNARPSHRDRLDLKFPPMFEAVRLARVDLIEHLLNWGAPTSGPVPEHAADWKLNYASPNAAPYLPPVDNGRVTILDVACHYDHRHLMDWMHASARFSFNPSNALLVAVCAGATNCMSELIWMQDDRSRVHLHGKTWDEAPVEMALNAAAFHHRAKIMVFLAAHANRTTAKTKRIVPKLERCLSTCIQFNYADGIAYHHVMQDCVWPTFAPVLAVQHGQRELLRRLHHDMNGFTEATLGGEMHRDLMRAAVVSNDLAILAFLCEDAKCVPQAANLREAAEAGHVEVVRFLCRRFPQTCSLDRTLADVAAGFTTHTPLCPDADHTARFALLDDLLEQQACVPTQWSSTPERNVVFCQYLLQQPADIPSRLTAFLRHGGQWSSALLGAAIQYGREHVVHMALTAQDCPPTELLYGHAIQFGRIGMCKLLDPYVSRIDLSPPSILYVPSHDPHRVNVSDVFACLTHGIERHKKQESSPEDAESRHRALQQWIMVALQSRDRDWSHVVISGCIKHTSPDYDTRGLCAQAAAKGDLEALICLRKLFKYRLQGEIRVPDGESAVKFNAAVEAAKHGHLTCLHYVCMNRDDVPENWTHEDAWTYEIMMAAVRHGQLDCLVYAHKNLHSASISKQNWRDMHAVAKEQFQSDIMTYMHNHMRHWLE